MNESDLSLRPEGGKVKIALAQRLRKETTMSLKSIAERLQIGSWSYVSNLLAARRHGKKRCSVNSENRPLYDPFTLW
jgi:hypothetical protein